MLENYFFPVPDSSDEELSKKKINILIYFSPGG